MFPTDTNIIRRAVSQSVALAKFGLTILPKKRIFRLEWTKEKYARVGCEIGIKKQGTQK